MTRQALSLFLLLLAVGWLPAQSYNTSTGLRLGTDWGMTIKQRVAKKVTVEAILQSSVQHDEGMFTLIPEWHKNVLSRRISLYGGTGLHAGWTDEYTEQGKVKNPFGVSLLVGGEITFAKLNLSFDVKPAVNLVGGRKRFYTQSGVSVRYVVAKRRTPIIGNKQKYRERQREKRKKKRVKRREQRKKDNKGFRWPWQKKSDR